MQNENQKKSSFVDLNPDYLHSSRNSYKCKFLSTN